MAQTVKEQRMSSGKRHRGGKPTEAPLAGHVPVLKPPTSSTGSTSRVSSVFPRRCWRLRRTSLRVKHVAQGGRRGRFGRTVILHLAALSLLDGCAIAQANLMLLGLEFDDLEVVLLPRFEPAA